MHENKSANRNPANYRLYHALIEALIDDEDVIDREVADTVKDHKRKHDSDDDDDNEGPLARLNQDEQPTEEIPSPNDMHVSDPEDIDNAHIPKVPTTTTWFRPLPEEERPASPEPEWIIPRSELPKVDNNWADDLEYLLLGDKGRKTALSMSKLKAAHYPDFRLEELLPSLWIESEHQNIVIRKRVEDLQLGIKSYHTKLNLEQPNKDASDFLFKEDYTIVYQPRAVIYRDRNEQKKMLRIDEVHKFSDRTLTRIRDKLDFMVKDFKLFEYNKGMENRIWSEDDK
ncbi:hypothetical protein Tco_0882672 [Tanacetum coccineum]